MQTAFLLAFIALIAAATLSLFFKNEGVRGGGRVVLGAAIGALGGYMWFEPVSHAASVILVACAAITGVLGMRKFLRRND